MIYKSGPRPPSQSALDSANNPNMAISAVLLAVLDCATFFAFCQPVTDFRLEASWLECMDGGSLMVPLRLGGRVLDSLRDELL